MRKLLVIIALALSACATQPRVDAALQQINDYGITSQAEAEYGVITWESRYLRLFEIAAGIENQILRSGFRKAYSEFIPIARRFDAKQISPQDFEDARRGIKLTLEATMDEARRVQAAQSQARNAAIAQSIKEGQERQNQIMQDTQRSLMRQQTNCTSDIYGNTVQTTCR